MEKRLHIGGISIIIHPHGPAKYADLWRRAFQLKRPILFRGDYKAMIGGISPAHAEQGPITGQFYRFFDLRTDEPWYNLEEAKPADGAEMQQIKIPANLRPHFSMFNYALFPERHELYFETKTKSGSLSPGALEKVLSALLNDPKLVERFGQVEVAVIPEADSLQRILAIPRLARLHVSLVKPNPDDLDQPIREVEERLDTMHVRRLEQTYVAERGESIELDERARVEAEAASRHGKVVGEGYDANDAPVVLSTQSMPLAVTHAYNPNKQTALAALIEKVTQLVRPRRRPR